MFCTNCGQQIDDNSAFCPFCGVHTENGPTELQLPALVGAPQSNPNEIVQDIYSQPEAYQQFAQQQAQFQQAQYQQAQFVQQPAQYGQDPFQQQGQFQQAPYQKAPKVKKPINKKIFVILGIVLGVLALAAIGILVFKKLSGGSKGDSFVYVTDSDINFVKNPKALEAVELSSNKGDEVTYRQVFYSPEGKFVYFFTKIDDDDDIGTLNRVLTSKIGTKNMDQFVETIGSDISLYKVYCLDEERVVYSKVGKKNDSLCVYDGESETKIAKDVYTCYIDDDRDYIVYLTEDEDEYGCDMYRAPVNDIENADKLDSNVDYVYNSGDLSCFLYEKYDEDEYEYNLYSADAEGNTDHLYDDVETYTYVGDDDKMIYYIMAPTGDTIDPYDYVDLDTDDIDGYDDEDEKEYYEMETYDLYCWSDGEISDIDEGIISYDGFSGALVYNKTDNLDTVEDLEDEVYWASDIKYCLDVEDTSENFVVEYSTGIVYQMSGKADDLWADMEDHYSYYTICAANGNFYMYDEDEEELYEVDAEDNEISGISKIESDCGVAGIYDDKIYYATDYYTDKKDHGFADFYEYSNGESKLIGKELYTGSVQIFEDGTVYGATDVDDDEYEIVVIKAGEVVDTIGDEITQIMRLEGGNILYINDDDLYLYNGKESVKIDSDVIGIYPENQETAAAYLYYYDYDYDDED